MGNPVVAYLRYWRLPEALLQRGSKCVNIGFEDLLIGRITSTKSWLVFDPFLTTLYDTIKFEDDMSLSYQSADSGGGPLCFKLQDNKLLLLFLLFVVLKFKTQLLLPFRAGGNQIG